MQIITARAEGVDTSIMLLQLADNLQAAAQSAKDDQIAALALIKHAEALRTALHYRQGIVSRVELKATINRARAGYGDALEKASPNPSLTAAAKFGLGLCEEELGNFKDAKQIYSDVVADPNLEGTVAVSQAKLRLETMADYKQKVVFKASPKPPEFIQPPFQLGPADTNAADVDFVGTFLAGTNLTEMYVDDTNLADTNLVDINLSDTNLDDTNLGDVNQAGP